MIAKLKLKKADGRTLLGVESVAQLDSKRKNSLCPNNRIVNSYFLTNL